MEENQQQEQEAQPANQQNNSQQAEQTAAPETDFKKLYIEQLKNRTDVIPDLIQGDSIEELNTSLTKAQAAYKAATEQFVTIPTSAGGGQAPDRRAEQVAKLSPFDKIRYAVNGGKL
jgi:hypothetical protein